MNLDEARADVIKRFIYIESCVDSVLLKEIQPRKDRIDFVRGILLNTAIIPTSSKFKLLRHLIKLNNWPSTDTIHYHRFLQIRNQFAHIRGEFHIPINIKTNEYGEDIVEFEESFMLESLNNKDFLQKTDYKDALREFKEHYNELRRVLHAIRDQTA